MKPSTLSKGLFAGAFFLFAGLQSHAQYTLRFALGTRLCDTAAWTLVFSEDFDGTTIDRSKWHPFLSWSGMQPTEHDNWSGARLIGAHSIARDENVVLRNGICSLILKREPSVWRCDTCRETVTRPYSAGVLTTHYAQAFKYGRFEARMRFSKAPWTHGTFWTWPAEGPAPGKDIPEIDIAEAYGYKGIPIAGNNGFQHIEWATHRWRSDGRGSLKQSRRFPRQTFAAWLRRSYFDQTAWHTYAVEWDSSRIVFFLDGEAVDELWRYECQDENGAWQPSSCMPPAARPCREDPRWPTNDFSRGSNVRLTMDIDGDKARDDGEAGQMEIDYVRVWQRAGASGTP